MNKFSLEHQLFVKKHKKEKRIIYFFQIMIIMIFLIIWEILGKCHVINTFLFSSPSKIIKILYSLLQDGSLFVHISVTFIEVFLSFIISTIISIIMSFLLWRFPLFSKIIDPYITMLNSLPKVALGPLIIIWVGASIHSVIFMAVTITVFSSIINIYSVFSSVPSNYIFLFKSFHASKWKMFYKLILPYSFQTIIATLKVNISMSLIGVIMGELLVSKSGIGYLIMYGSQIFNLDLVISNIFVLSLISSIMYYALDLLIKTKNKKSKF